MYQLTKLSYLFQDLEPYIDTHTIGLHYHKHQQNYLNRLNELLIKNGYDYRYPLEELFYHITEFPMEDQKDILYYLGGVLNHNLYFQSMSPKKKRPIGKLLEDLERKYNSLDNFFEEFKKMAMKIKGSGYTFLVIDRFGNLEIINMLNQDMPISFGYVPLFAIDMWEHAYYLNYKNEKENYIDNFKVISDFSNASNIYHRVLSNLV